MNYKIIKDILEKTKKIAIVGLSPNPSKDSYMVGKYLQSKGFEIIPIYPKEDLILNQKVYRDLQLALQENQPDIVVVFRKSEAIEDIAKELLNSGFLPKLFWMQLGISNIKAQEILENKGIVVVSDKCMEIEHKKIFGE